MISSLNTKSKQYPYPNPISSKRLVRHYLNKWSWKLEDIPITQKNKKSKSKTAQQYHPETKERFLMTNKVPIRNYIFSLQLQIKINLVNFWINSMQRLMHHAAIYNFSGKWKTMQIIKIMERVSFFIILNSI